MLPVCETIHVSSLAGVLLFWMSNMALFSVVIDSVALGKKKKKKNSIADHFKNSDFCNLWRWDGGVSFSISRQIIELMAHLSWS